MGKSALNAKRLVTGLTLGCLIISLAACGTPAATPPPTPTAANPSPPVATGPANPPVSNTPPPISALPTPTITTPAPSLVPANPSVRILAPADFTGYHAAVIEQELKIAVAVTDFKLVDKIGQAAVPGEGHFIYYLNADPPTAPGVSAVSAGGSYKTTADTAIVWGDLPKGPQRVAVQLVNNDNTPLSPPVTDSVLTYLNYTVSAPGIKITSPGVAAVLPAGNITVQVSVRNFINVYNPTRDNISGEGHIIYYLDNDPPFIMDKAAFTAAGTYAGTAATSYTWPNVAPGRHTLAVQLVNNDSTPLSSTNYPVVDKVTVLVK